METVGDLLNRKGRAFFAIGPEATLEECASMMTENDVGSLLVQEGNALAGIITWHDVLRSVGALGTDSATTPVKELMSTELETTDELATLDDVRARMVRQKIRHLPVVVDGTLRGVVTLLDVLRLHLESANTMNQELESYIYGTHP